MLNYDIASLKKKIDLTKNKVVLFGAGDIGELTNYSLNRLGITVDFFCDNDTRKHGKKYLGIEVISPENLAKLNKSINIFISNNYVSLISTQLNNYGFKEIYNCAELLKKTDFSQSNEIKGLQPLKIERRIEYYRNMCLKDEYSSSGILNIKSLDVQITERCSLKCTNCSNLMQYYEKPVNSDLNQLFLAIERLMSCVNKIYEFRVLGGDPFMNKELHKVIDELKKYNQVEKVIVYTNGKIVPKGLNLDCLKDKKVVLDITNYGEISNKHDEIIKVLEENKIAFSTTLTTVWTDSGRILPYQTETEEEKKKKFINCCNSDILSILHGKLYRCPFSANATNLGAVPVDKTDIIDLCDKDTSIEDLKKKIKNLTYNKDFLTACSYCNGRDYTVANIKAAEQSKKPIEYKKV